MKNQVHQPMTLFVKALIAIYGGLIVFGAWSVFELMTVGPYNPDQGCDPRDLAGNPVDLKDAATRGVSVTTKNNCYAQP